MIATTHNHFGLLLRNEFRLYLRGGMAKGASLVFLIISQILLHLIALAVVLGTSMSPTRPRAAAAALIMLSVGLLGMFMLMTSRALASAVQALYTRGDIDLMLSSPVDRQSVLGVRMGAIALTVAMEVALLVWPFANVFVLFGKFAWFKAYLLVPAMAMLATSIGLVLTWLSFRTLGPRRTRLAVQILAVIMGVGFMLAFYLPRMLADDPAVRGPGADPVSTSMRMLVQNSEGHQALLLAPAQWVMQGFTPTLLFLLAATGLLVLAIRLTGDRIINAMTAIAGTGTRRVVRAAATSGDRLFRGSFRTVVVLKELRLIARDPYLIAQLLQQGVFALPMAFALWTGTRDSNLPLPWLAVIVVVAGMAAPLAWITITAEDAPDLLASAPVSRAALMRAKIEAALLPMLPLCVLPLFFLLRSHPWFAICTTFCAAGAALSAAVINMGNPVAKRRDSLRQRYKGNGGRGFLEVVSMLLWLGLAVGLVLGGKYLAGWN